VLTDFLGYLAAFLRGRAIWARLCFVNFNRFGVGWHHRRLLAADLFRLILFWELMLCVYF